MTELKTDLESSLGDPPAPGTVTGAGETAGVAGTGDESGAADDSPDILGVDVATIEKLKSTPEGMEIYRSLNQKATQKFQQIANLVKVAKALQENPAAAIAALAKHHGVKFGAEAGAQGGADGVVDAFTKRFGKEAGVALREAIDEHMVGTLEPFRKERLATAVGGHADAFLKAHPDAVQGSAIALKMSELIDKFPLEESKVEEVPGYLEMIYAAATAGQSRTDVTKEVTDRMQRSVKSVEPIRGVSKSGQRGYKEGMAIGDVFEDL